MRIAIAIILLFAAGCVVGPLPTETPAIPETPISTAIPLTAMATIPVPAQATPTQEIIPTKNTNCPGYDASLELLTDNFCLSGPYTIVWDNNVHQVVPDGFELYSVNHNADGYTDAYSAHAPIACEEWGCTIDVHNGVMGINGIWGYSQTVEHNGCILVKLTGNGRVNDPSHPGDYAFNVFVDDAFRSSQLIPIQGYFELVYSMSLTGATKITLAVQVRWSVPGEGSEIILYGAGVYAVPEDYCN